MNGESSGPRRLLPPVVGFAAIVGCLYLAREFLLPVVLAALLCFLLVPLMKWLERRGFGRVPAVLTTTILAFVVFGALTYVVAGQLFDFAADLPKYKSNILAKVTALRAQSGGPLGRAMDTVEELTAAATSATKTTAAGTANAPVPVEVVQSSGGPADFLKSLLLPFLGSLGNAAMVVIIVIFMLLGREDLRDRLIHLVGRGHLRLTTEALDEASSRVSRYLLAQLVVNVTYGIPIAVGLYFIGVPNAVLWGILATVLRFLPYIGPWIAASFPIALSLAVSTGWTQFLLTIALFVVIELISNNVVEPWLYGASTGLSPLAVILSAFFWAWLWGGVGLVLATPLTVCVAVAGKYVPGLGFLDVLLGDKPPIAKSERLYQRVLALDEDEVCELAERAMEERGIALAADEVLLPVLRTLEADARGAVLPEKSRTAALGLLRQVTGELSPAAPPLPATGSPVLCLPALNDADEFTALLLCEALRVLGVAARVASSKLLISEGIEQAVESGAAVICVVSFPPLSTLIAANLCQRLRERLPETHITAILWEPDSPDFARRRERLKRRGAYDVFSSIDSALPTLVHLAGCEPNPAPPPEKK
jgi:predicted PurR-regulated permease PerM